VRLCATCWHALGTNVRATFKLTFEFGERFKRDLNATPQLLHFSPNITSSCQGQEHTSDHICTWLVQYCLKLLNKLLLNPTKGDRSSKHVKMYDCMSSNVVQDMQETVHENCTG